MGLEDLSRAQLVARINAHTGINKRFCGFTDQMLIARLRSFSPNASLPPPANPSPPLPLPALPPPPPSSDATPLLSLPLLPSPNVPSSSASSPQPPLLPPPPLSSIPTPTTSSPPPPAPRVSPSLPLPARRNRKLRSEAAAAAAAGAPSGHCSGGSPNAPGGTYCSNSSCRAALAEGAAFCRRCSCWICRKYDDNKDPSLWILCGDGDGVFVAESCGLSCHIQCAISSGNSAVGDASYRCLSCGTVTGLLGSLRRQFIHAKEARRVDVLHERLALANKILSGSEKHQRSGDCARAALGKLLEEFGPESPLLARGLVSRLSSSAAILGSIKQALESLDNVDLKPAVPEPPVFKFQIINVTTNSVLLAIVKVSGSVGDAVIGYKLWHKRGRGAYRAAPTTSFTVSQKALITDLQPGTRYTFKAAAYSAKGDEGFCETKCLTKRAPEVATPVEKALVLKVEAADAAATTTTNPIPIDDDDVLLLKQGGDRDEIAATTTTDPIEKEIGATPLLTMTTDPIEKEVGETALLAMTTNPIETEVGETALLAMTTDPIEKEVGETALLTMTTDPIEKEVGETALLTMTTDPIEKEVGETALLALTTNPIEKEVGETALLKQGARDEPVATAMDGAMVVFQQEIQVAEEQALVLPEKNAGEGCSTADQAESSKIETPVPEPEPAPEQAREGTDCSDEKPSTPSLDSGVVDAELNCSSTGVVHEPTTTDEPTLMDSCAQHGNDGILEDYVQQKENCLEVVMSEIPQENVTVSAAAATPVSESDRIAPTSFRFDNLMRISNALGIATPEKTGIVFETPVKETRASIKIPDSTPKAKALPSPCEETKRKDKEPDNTERRLTISTVPDSSSGLRKLQPCKSSIEHPDLNSASRKRKGGELANVVASGKDRGSGSKSAWRWTDKMFEDCVKVVRWLECEGHLKPEFRMRFFTWLGLKASEQERRVVSIYIQAMRDDPDGLAEQLVDAFEEAISTSRQSVSVDRR